MEDKKSSLIGQSLFGFQSALIEGGSSLKEYIEENYYNQFISDTLYCALKIRTTFIVSLHNFLLKKGLLNIDRVSLSPITDPLAHDVEHIPSIHYKGHLYVTTHSMIYHKFLACHNKNIKGIFVDSPNIRLELESPDKVQRGKYLIDFSQLDVEIRRNSELTLDDYLHKRKKVEKVLKEDFEKAISFFEEMLIFGLKSVVENNEDELKFLGVAIELPKKPLPRFRFDEAKKKFGLKGLESGLGKETKSQFFFITGIPRENYDLIYPYLLPKGKVKREEISSEMVYNYDICGKSIVRKTGKQTEGREIFSGAIREWLFEAIVERLIDNNIIEERPIIVNGNITNIANLGGYGPFLLMASRKDENDRYSFPETFGGGIGIERTLFTILRGPKIDKIEQVTCFGKNPDSHQLYLF